MDHVKRLGPILATAAMFNLAFAPTNLSLLVFVALIPWLISLRTATGRGALRGGYTLGVLIWGVQMYWLVPLTGKWVGNAALGVLPLAVVCFLGAWYFALLGFLIQRAMARGWLWAIPLLWGGLEVVRSFVPHLGFPYFHLATPLWPFPTFTNSAFFGTIYLVSAWVAAINLLGFALMVRQETKGQPAYQFRAMRRILIPVLLVFIAGSFRYATPPAGKQVVVTAGQPGIDLAFTPPEEEANRLVGAVAGLAAEATAKRSQLLVLPEGIARGEGEGAPQTAFAIPHTVPILFGAHRLDMSGPVGTPAQDTLKTYQSAYAFDGMWKHSDKARLVVFGEYVPGRGVLPFLDKFNLPSGDLTPAVKTTPLEIGNLTVGSLICFEGLFFDVAQRHVDQGAQILTVMSIDDWYMGTGAPDQLRAAAVWRAAETGLPLVRAGGLGYSMVIDGRGRVLGEAPLGRTTAISVNVWIEDKPQNNPLRPMVAWALGVAFLVLIPVLWRRPKPATPSTDA